MKSKEKGDLAVGHAIAYYISQNYEVCLPIGDKRDYDFVIEKNGLLEKVQVKFAGLYKDGQCKVGLRITGGNQSFHKSHKYKDNSFNFLFIFTQKGQKYVVPWRDVDNRNEISIEHPKYRKYLVS
jgi:PD-(D/E)XK endonuclease